MVKTKLKNEEHLLDFLTEEESLAREQRHFQRLHDVRISVAFIRHAFKKYEKLKAEELELEKWDDYLACDGMPRPDLPSEIRQFLMKLRHEEHMAATDDISWVLLVNERSILSHAPDRQDLTRRNLDVTARPNIGKFYDKTVQGILQTHKRVERVLRNETELLDMPTLRAFELTKIPGELLKEVETFFDKLAYRVICAPEAYMMNKDSMLSYYCYNCSHFNFQIWGLQDVPIRFQYLRLPLMYSDLKCIKATLQLPLSVLSDNLTLRCVHTFFDPFSHLAKSVTLNFDAETSPSCGILEMEDSLISEWETQMDIRDDLIMKMEEQMEAYNVAKAAIEAALAAKQKKQGDNAKGPSVPKAPKMPLAIPEGKLPDPYPLFLKQTRQECNDFFNENFHPDNINLQQYEVNMRRYMIVGGVFSMVFMRKPRHTAFEKLNLTLHEDGRVLQVVLDQLNRSRDSSSSDLFGLERGPTRPNIDMEATDSDLKLHLEPDELPFYFITFTIPDNLCLWADPLVCHFIEEEIEGPTVEEDVLLEDLDKKNKKKRRKTLEAMKVKDAGRKSSSMRSTDDAINIKEPRNLTSVNIYRASALDMVRKSYNESENVNNEALQDFVPNMEANNRTRASLVKTICMPRIISSFKFPKEFKETPLDEQPTQRASGHLSRRRVVENVIADEITEFVPNYEDQADPERLFPIFPETMDSHKMKQYEFAAKQAEDPSLPCDTVYELIQTLDEIKEKYEDGPRKLAEQTAIQAVRMSKRHIAEFIPTRGAYKSRASMRRSGSVYGEIVEREIESDSRGESDSDVNAFTHTVKLKKKTEARPSEISRLESNKVIHWTTEYILESNFDRNSKILTVKTDRLGNFGFAYPRYNHFPFRHWHLEANEENPDELTFTLDTQYVRVVFIVSKDGIRGYATDVPKVYVAKPVKYMNFEKPVGDFVELRKLFQDNNLNVFPELDAFFYIDQGYFSEKHLAAEVHIYDAMAVHCKQLKFKHNDWNRLATDRDIVLCLRSNNALDNVDVTVRVTPENATFVEVSELCSENLDAFQLHYKRTWRNIGIYTDLHQLINSMNPNATDTRNRDSGQMFYLRKLLQEIRPLSFS
ncbi:uncharacterized protein [Drosophila kikkawai]|uniref:Uncharacterized protein isoform X1 n=1 Tax=Drosophila kikkawai TaxID=30033 RepID=A0A6P4J4P7_DROKI|nr:uncharacterized protein LOC108080193 isoform X1 [Drosophila kikkawai]